MDAIGLGDLARGSSSKTSADLLRIGEREDAEELLRLRPVESRLLPRDHRAPPRARLPRPCPRPESELSEGLL
jgi:hypothetical protein